MKKIFKIGWVLSLLTLFVACTKEVPATDPQLEPSYINIHGLWQTVEVNGIPFPEKVMMYKDFNRKDHSFKEYSNHGTMYPDMKHGYFKIAYDRDLGYLVSGSYIIGSQTHQDWNDQYVIEELTENTMSWKRLSDGEIQKMVRRQQLPQEFDSLRK